MNDFTQLKQLYEENDIDAVNLIINSNTIVDNYDLLIDSVIYNNIDIVKLLLEFVVIKENDSEALYLAVENQNLQMVKLLLPFSEAYKKESRCLFNASENGYFDIIKELIPFSDCELVLSKLKNKKHKMDEELVNQSIKIIDEYLFNNKQQKNILNELTNEIDTSINKNKRKI